MVQLYDPKRPAQAMLRYKGTLWEHVLVDPWFWFFLATCILFILLRTLDVLPKGQNPEIPTSSLAIIGSLVSFAAVFFLNMVFGRFHDQLLMMIAVGGNIYNCISLAVSTFEGEHARARANQLARYGNALNHVCFYTIGQVSQGQFLYLVQNRMLSPDEAEILGEFKGKMTNLLATWMLDTLETASREGTARRIDRATREIILEIRKNAALLQDMQRFPPPLGYYHFLVVALHSWLFLLAYSTPYLPENNNQVWLTFPLYFVIAFTYMGISAVATAHVDPWGADSSDVDILTEIDSVLRQTRQLLHDKYHPALHTRPKGLDFEGGYKAKEKPFHHKSRSKSLYNLPGVITYLQPKSKAVAKYIARSNESELGVLVKQRHRFIEEEENVVMSDGETTSIGIDSPHKCHATQSIDSCSYEVSDSSNEMSTRPGMDQHKDPAAATSSSDDQLTAK